MATFLGPASSTILLILLVVVSTFSMTVQSSEIETRSLRKKAMHDALTGLLNRQGFHEVAQRQIDRLNRHGTPGVLIVMDLDHFKNINDTYGHPGGDAVLRTFANISRQRVRSTDLLARYGGEEFLLLLEGIELPTVSFGIAGTDQHGGNLGTIIRAADQALYLAKRNGHNQSVVA